MKTLSWRIAGQCVLLVLFWRLQGGEACTSVQHECDNGRCISLTWTCDDDDDCGDGSDERNCAPKTCGPTDFLCANGTKCIPQRWQCDGDKDCEDGSDEDINTCTQRSCLEGQISCGEGSMCIPESWKCDDQEDCPNGADEIGCQNHNCSAEEFTCDSGKCIAQRWVCDQDHDCGDDDDSDERDCPAHTCNSLEFMCKDKRCIPSRWRCDGDADCGDMSDEADCPETPTHAVCSEREFTCANHDCIHKAWHCDGDSDCTDGSDELDCPKDICGHTMFQCNNTRCIDGFKECNGQDDCGDNSDEENCEKPASCDAKTQFDCAGDGTMCIPLNKVCNKIGDCTKNEDEDADLCNPGFDPCSTPEKGGCSQKCITTYGSKYLCECNPGYQLLPDNKTCVDINECEIPGSCSQLCENVKGSYKCSCRKGYFIDPKMPHFCKAGGEAPILLFANRHDVRAMHFDRNHFRDLVTSTRSAIALDFDYKNHRLFYSDVAHEKILSISIDDAPLESSEAQEIVTVSISTPDGVAFDWIHNHLYWTDTGKNTIEVINLDSGDRTILLSDELDEPRAIVVDPRDGQGWMYWSDWGSKAKIERAGLDGSHRQSIITSDIEWPNGLTIDYEENRLYWVDAKGHMICSSDLRGTDRTIVMSSIINLKHPFAITVFEDWVFWTDWETEGIHKANKFTGKNVTDIAQKLYSPMDLHVYHELKQPNATNKCESAECSHLCLPSPQFSPSSSKYSCACPEGMTLSSDRLNCEGEALSTTTTQTTSKSEISGTTPAGTLKKPVLKPHQIENQNQDIGKIAGIVVGIILVVAIIGALIGFLLYRSYMRRNIKSMNFDNPVYRKTTEDQFSLEKNQYQPSRTLPSTLEPLTAPSNDLV